MDHETATTMDAIDIAEFLAGQETGVLALADGDDAYAIPVSFTYADEEGAFYFRLGYAPGSEKRRYVESSETVSFVVHDETPEGWKSVVASGRLEELSEDALDAAVIEAARKLDIPYFAVHDRPVQELETAIVRLGVSTLSGIVEGGDGG